MSRGHWQACTAEYHVLGGYVEVLVMCCKGFGGLHCGRRFERESDMSASVVGYGRMNES